jgi:Tfp pilus assembly protein PilF
LSTDIKRLVSSPVTLLATGLFSLIALACMGFFFWSRWRRSSLDDVARSFPNTAPDVAYVGDTDCRICHADIARNYLRSGMARSWSAPTPEHLALAQEGLPSVADAKLNLSYCTFAADGQLIQEEFRLDSDGSRVHSLTRPASYVVGSGNHGYSFVSETNGYMTLLPLGWYSEAAQWDLSPGYRRHNQRFEREVPAECVACHNDFPDHVAGSRNRYRTPLPSGISCERCHGPGDLHVKVQSGELPAPPAGEPDRSIVNPARLPVDRQDDVCLECHLISDVAVFAPGKEWHSFRPGQRLRDVRRDLFLKPEDPAQFGFSSHGTRLRLSRCWTEGPTRGSLTCITCHDAHKPLRETPRATYVQRCLDCHEAQDCRRPQPDAQPGSDCIDCHMRRGKPADVAHTVFTDHWIQSRPEPLRDAGTMSAERTPDPRRPVAFIDFWEGGEVRSPRVQAIGLAKYFDVRRAPDRRQALESLEAALERDPKDARLNFWHGATLASMRQFRPALEAYRKAAERLSDPLTASGTGEAQRELGRIQDAIATLTGCVKEYPDFLPTYRELAETCVAAGNLEAARMALDRSLALFPHQPETRVRRAHLGFLAGESIEKVLEQIDAAMQLSPDSASLHWLMAECYASEGRTEPALEAYETALRIDPKFVPALLSLGPALLRAGRLDEAQRRLNQLRAIAPNHPLLPSAEQELHRLRQQPR